MGFVKVPDDLMKWEWIDDKNTVYVYLRLLLGASWCETGRHGIMLKRGQLITTLPSMCSNFGLTTQQARTILERLKSTGKITVETTNKFRIITINNYDCVFENNSQNSSSTTGRQQITPQPNNSPSLLNTNIQNNRAADTRGGFDKVKEAFNSLCPSLPRLEYDLSIQQTHLIEQARLRLGGVSFEEFFKRVERSDFLCGRTSSGFKADFNWILRPENVNKILAGNYDHSLKPASRANERSAHKSWEDYTDEEIAREAEKLYE